MQIWLPHLEISAHHPSDLFSGLSGDGSQLFLTRRSGRRISLQVCGHRIYLDGIEPGLLSSLGLKNDWVIAAVFLMGSAWPGTSSCSSASPL